MAQYMPIDLSKDAFRLVRLHAGYSGPIHCELFQSYLDPERVVPYEALSYVWGDKSDMREVWLNGSKHLVTSNLAEALRSLRLADEDRVLWIDAICIDQKNDKEKGHQVHRMRHIYANAELVIIWLGPSDENIDLLLGAASNLDQRALAAFTKRRHSEWVQMEEGRLDWNMSTEVGRGRFEALQNLLNRPWFRRIWIVQEAATARRAMVRCGFKSLSARTFPLLPRLTGLQDVSLQVQAILDIMPSSLRSSPDSWWSGNRTLKTLLQKFAGCESTDDRNLIYALLGISFDFSDTTCLIPDYEITFEEVIRNTARALLFGEPLGRDEFNLPPWGQQKLLESLDNLPDRVSEWAISVKNEPLMARLLKLSRQRYKLQQT